MSTVAVGIACETPENKSLHYISNCPPIYSNLSVYNKWGELIFLETNTNIGFNGFRNTGKKKDINKRLPQGTYFYSFEYKFKEHQPTDTLTGTVYLYHENIDEN